MYMKYIKELNAVLIHDRESLRLGGCTVRDEMLATMGYCHVTLVSSDFGILDVGTSS